MKLSIFCKQLQNKLSIQRKGSKRKFVKGLVTFQFNSVNYEIKVAGDFDPAQGRGNVGSPF